MYLQNYYDNTASNSGWQDPLFSSIEIDPDTENGVIINALFYGNYSDVFNNYVYGTYDKSSSTISITNGSKFAEYKPDENTVTSLYLYALDAKSHEILDKTIDFTYSNDSHTFTYSGMNGTKFAEYILVLDEPNVTPGTVKDQGYAFIPICNLSMINGEMSYTQRGHIDLQKHNYIYSEVGEYDKNLTIFNIFNVGFEQGVTMSVDLTNENAYMSEQYVHVKINSSDESATRMTFSRSNMYTGLVPPGINFKGGFFDGGEAEYYTWFKNSDPCYLVNYPACDYYYQFEDVEIYLWYDGIFGHTGIETVSDDFDMNAPVEYYNLQGIRVDNPTHGLYIMRQGSKTTKIFR